MALIIPLVGDRVRETTSTIGTGTVSLNGAVTGFQSFTNAFTTGSLVYYCITDALMNWEAGYGTFTTGAPATLSRTVIFASSNAGAAVNFAAGNKDVFNTFPAYAAQHMLMMSGTTGSAIIPAGTTAQRDASPLFGYTRTNTDLNRLEWWNNSNWVQAGGGATGGGTDGVFVENDVVVTQSYTIGQGAYVAGVTMTIATPAVFTLANHGFVASSKIIFSTTGALPTGLSANTVYYVLAAGLTTNNFEVSLMDGGTAVATSGTQSGVHSVSKVKNAVVAGPLTIVSGAVVTIPNGSVLTIV